MAGGESQVGGNGSVWWRVTHYDENTPPKKRKLKAAGKGKPENHEVELSDYATGHDRDTPAAQVGARFGRPGFFRVTLHYPNADAARAAGEYVAQNAKPSPDGGVALTLVVPAIDRPSPPADDQPWEIKVEW